ncbi:hypothetical protein DW074_17670 [Ruminococcus sp. AF46-10NS]|nr:hypothetical protein [Ruminococcus sp. AF46-10NS]RHK18851.1 hypothetical protein DW074_17670 [Ruminococcus sp. AF46-10NS]
MIILKLVENAYKNRGGISGQREALKQKTAISIRNRMIADIKEGTILPPIVVGIVIDEVKYKKLESKEINFEELEIEKNAELLSIIDGMQRTTALMKACSENDSVGERELRVEYWISDNNNSLLYRMLVLNTGQVPWNVRRQIEVIFSGIIKEIKNKVDCIAVLQIEDSARRKKGGQYQASELVELFLAFGARTWKVNTKEKLTDEFTRHDFLQSSGEIDLIDMFCEILKCMAEIDILLDEKYKISEAKEEVEIEINQNDKFKNGKDLFASQPARIGFVAAAGEKIIGRPGEERSAEKIKCAKNDFLQTFETIKESIEEKKAEELIEYIDFSTLNQKMERRTTKVGDYERELFYEAFKVAVDEKGKMDNLGICWRTF